MMSHVKITDQSLQFSISREAHAKRSSRADGLAVPPMFSTGKGAHGNCIPFQITEQQRSTGATTHRSFFSLQILGYTYSANGMVAYDCF